MFHGKLGKKPARHDPRNFKLARYLTALPAAPATAHYGRTVIRDGGVFPMYGNDVYGDCTCAAAGHHEQVWSFNEGAPETPAEHSVLDLYWATGAEDDGRYLDDVLKEWREGAGLAGEHILGYAQVDVTNLAEVKTALWLFGGLYLGVGLPITAQQQTTWHIDRYAPADEQAPYSWGGHCVNASGYGATTGVYFVTWGRLMRMTWAFWKRYVDEAFAIISPDWLSKGVSPAAAGGFDLSALQADLAALH